MAETAGTNDSYGAGLVLRPTMMEACAAIGLFHLCHYNADGDLIYEDDFENLWTTVGKNDVLDKYLGLAAANSAIHGRPARIQPDPN